MHSWAQATLWLSVGLYGYLIVHHALQAILTKSYRMNLLLLAFIMSSLGISVVDAQLYRQSLTPPENAFTYAAVQFLLSSLCGALFVQIADDQFRLRLHTLTRFLWGITIPLPLLTALGWILKPVFEAEPLIVGGYYLRALSTSLGGAYSALYLAAFLFTFLTAYRRWYALDVYNRAVLGVLSLGIPLIVVDMLVYYGLIQFVPTWSLGIGTLALGLSLQLNLQAHYLSKELARTNQELQQVYQQLMAQERAGVVGQVVRGIVHDLKNFFNNVQSLAEVGILRARKDPQFDAARYFGSIRDATQQAHQYLQDLLSLTRNEQTLELSEVAPAQVAREVERLVGAHLLNPPVQIVNNIPLSLRMHADRRYLMQLFLNLTLNAVQALQRWHGERRIEYDWIEDSERTILVVRDTGPGIPPEVRERLFEQSITTRSGGSGVGLMLVRHAVEKHDGTIQVISEPGKGATFVCIFPTPPIVEVSRAATVASAA